MRITEGPTVFDVDYPPPAESTWTARDFKFHTGETLDRVNLHYRTLGEPRGSRSWCCTGRGLRRQSSHSQLRG